MVIEFLIVFFLLVLFRGLNEEKFTLSKFHWKALPVLFVVCELLSYLVVKKSGMNEWNRQSLYLLHLLSYFLLFLFALGNVYFSGFTMIAAGFFLNFMAILLNGGRMPVSENGLFLAGQFELHQILENGNSITHVLIDDSTVFPFLGDIIPFVRPYFFPKVVSVGDVLIFLGLILFVMGTVIRNSGKKKTASK